MSIEYDEPLFSDNTNLKRGRVSHKPKPEKAHKLSLEEALTTLKALGFTINIPTSEEDKAKQDQTSSKLGFLVAKPEVKRKSFQRLKGTLTTTHRIGTDTYGPGELDLPLDQQDLFRSLLQQDQACVRAHMDTTEYTTQSRCYFIQPSTSRDSQSKFGKHEVSETVFNSDIFTIATAVTAGGVDIAGYNPTVGQETRDF